MKKLFVWLYLCGASLAAAQPGVWLDVPFVKQEKDGCGAASIAMVMQYWMDQQGSGGSIDSVEIQRALYSKEDHGIRASDLEKYFQEHGFRAFAFQGTKEELKKHLEKGRPLIVALKPEGNGGNHYVVVTGLDWENGIVQMNDPAQRKLLKQHWSDFEKQWSAVGKWTLLAVPQPPLH